MLLALVPGVGAGRVRVGGEMSHVETTAEPPLETTIALTVRLPVPMKRVFQALTDPRDLEVWVWGGIGREVRAEVDLRRGGRYRVSVEVGERAEWPRSRWAMEGLYVEVVPPHRLVYTVHWDAPVGYNRDGGAIDEVVFIDLVACEQETEVHYLHAGVPTPEAAAAHREAILHTFELLRRHLEG